MDKILLSNADYKDSTEIKFSGDSSGHGDQIRIGFIHSGKYEMNYYIMISNDGYPNRYGGGGFVHLLPKNIFENINNSYGKLTAYIKKEYSSFEISSVCLEKDFIEKISHIKDTDK